MIIRINGEEFESPPNFAPVPKPLYTGSLTNGNGETISTYVGDKMTFPFKYDFMPISELDRLTEAIKTQPIVVEYLENGEYVSFNTRRIAGITKTEFQYNPTMKRYEWHNISLKLVEL